MWLPHAPTPGPTPTVYVYLDQVGSGGGGLPPWVTTIAPFVVSIVALGGAIWSARHSAKTTLKAEDRRAAAAIAAEDRRAAAAIAAEDRRAAAAIAAEDRRHEHETETDERIWRRSTKSDAYFKLLNSITTALEGVRHYSVFISHAGPSDGEYSPRNAKMAGEAIVQWNNARDEIGPLVSTIQAVGSRDIAHRVDHLMTEASDVLVATEEAKAKAKDDPSRRDIRSMMDEPNDKLGRLRFRLVRAIRAELGVDDLPASLAAPTTADAVAPESPPSDSAS